MLEFFKNAFRDMKRSAEVRHEIDRAHFEAVRVESRANFENNRGRCTLARAKKHRNAAKMEGSAAHFLQKRKMQTKP